MEYSVVAVLGCQSSGKSTLLNKLFGTDFQVMDQEKGRTQTTKGIWLSYHSGEKLVILDVEGTDSKERGADHVSFERKSGLFSLALAEVLLVNLWMHDIGRYEAANYGLLRAVFELNLQLFSKNRNVMTTLMFVIRDYNPRTTPMESLRQTLMDDLSKIWSEMSKPEEFGDVGFVDFFRIVVHTLPHYEYQFEQWEGAVENLKICFSRNNEEALVGKSYAKAVPADGFAYYATGLWDEIIHNKDVDLPGQMQMLASFRCSEFKDNALEQVKSSLSSLEEEVGTTSFVRRLEGVLQAAFTLYDESCKMYDHTVRANVRVTLGLDMEKVLQSVMLPHLKTKETEAVALFHMAFGVAVVPQRELQAVRLEQFDTLSKKALEDALHLYGEALSVVGRACSSAFVLSEDQHAAALRTQLQQAIDAERFVQLALLRNEVEGTLRKACTSTCRQQTEQLSEDYTTTLQEALEEVYRKQIKLFQAACATLNVAEQQDIVIAEEMLQVVVTEAVQDFADEFLKRLPGLLQERFVLLFRFDEHHVPRSWSESEDIHALYIAARSTVLDMLAAIQPLEMGRIFFGEGRQAGAANYENVILLSEKDKKELEKTFRNDAELNFLEARSVQEARADVGKTPAWLMLMLVVLGWNEFIFFLSNPLYLILLLIFGAILMATKQAMQFPVVATLMKSSVKELLSFTATTPTKSTGKSKAKTE